MTSVQAWATAPQNKPAELTPATTAGPCEDPSCVTCQVGEAGALTICRMAGVDWAGLAPHERGHYAAIAMEVFADMSEKLIELRAVDVADDDVIDVEVVGE